MNWTSTEKKEIVMWTIIFEKYKIYTRKKQERKKKKGSKKKKQERRKKKGSKKKK